MDEAIPKQAGRRDFLKVATGGMISVGAAAAAWPLIDQMNPNPGSISFVDADIGGLKPGEQKIFNILGLPIGVRHRYPEEIAIARSTPFDDLKDILARSGSLPTRVLAADEYRSFGDSGEIIVCLWMCTRESCVLISGGDYGVDRSGSPVGGHYCPCCGSHFDTSLRVRKGPAPENAAIPRFQMKSPTVLRFISDRTTLMAKSIG